METDPLQWLPDSFYRQPNWRWLRAEYLIATGRRMNARIDDEWVSTARKVLQGRRTESASKVAAVRAAREIQFGKPAVKEEWEARLLTEEPLECLAERFAVPTIVVEAFSELFFVVRSMRKATDWLLARAIGFSALSGFTHPMPYAAWKFAAFVGGPHLLDVVMAATTGDPLGFATATWMRSDPEIRLRLRARLWVATMAAVTNEEFARVVQARRQLRALDARLASRVESMTPSVAAM